MKRICVQLALTALVAVCTIRCGGSATAPTSTPAVPNVPTATALASVSLSASTVVGGNLLTGTAALTMAAPAGGVIVQLSGGNPVTVPASVIVVAGATSATFIISTQAVASTVIGAFNASYAGTSITSTFSVTGPVGATARFGVSGPSETQTCNLTNSGNTLDCTFDGSTSSAVGTIVAWDWSWGVAATFTQTTTGPVLTMPSANCSLVPSPPFPAGTTWFPLVVSLKVHDSLGNVSAVLTDSSSRLFPQGTCGF